MTAALFRVLGALTFLVGIAWTILILATPSVGGSTSSAASAGMLIGKFMAAAPGVGMAVSGLLLLAIGEALWHLARIARNTTKLVHTSEDIAEILQPPKPSKDAASNFNDAIQMFQAKTGKAEAGAAIRDLASDALRQKGFLR